MPCHNVPSRSRASSQIWPHVAVLTLVGLAAAGCSDSARLDSNPYASSRRPGSRKRQDRSDLLAPGLSPRVESQPLPAPSRPATVASSQRRRHRRAGPGRLPAPAPSDVTGSVSARHARRRPRRAGIGPGTAAQPVTVSYGETVESIARKYGVPASAIMETNGFREGALLRPGQRAGHSALRVGQREPQAPTNKPSFTPRVSENVHIVEPGESMMGIARKHGVTLTALARANNIQPYAKINIGDRLTIPGGRRIPRPSAQSSTPAPHVAQPRTVPARQDGQRAGRKCTHRDPRDPHQGTELVTKSAEAVGAMPSFRWPVKGRIIAAFGPPARTAVRMTASIWRCRRALRSRRPMTVSSLMPAMS